MEKLRLLIPAIIVTGLVYLISSAFTTMAARDGTLIGQAKKLTLVTPYWSFVCPNYYALDVSLGIMQNGTGSISHEDMWLTVINVDDLSEMEVAVKKGSIVKVKYNTRRWFACTEEFYAIGFEVQTP